MFIEWKKEYEIGVESIDAEHKSIIDEFEKLYEKMRVGEGHQIYGELVAFLEDYVNTHLEHEEAYQREVAYTGYEAHKAKHDEFRLIVEELKTNSLDQVSNLELIRINQIMKDWLINHILEEDMAIGDFVRGNHE